MHDFVRSSYHESRFGIAVSSEVNLQLNHGKSCPLASDCEASQPTCEDD